MSPTGTGRGRAPRRTLSILVAFAIFVPAAVVGQPAGPDAAGAGAVAAPAATEPGVAQAAAPSATPAPGAAPVTGLGAPLAGGNGWNLPEDVSVDGWRIDHLLWWTMGFASLLFVIMVIWMAVACLKHGRNHPAQYDHGSGKKQVKFAVALSAVIFFVVDGNLFVNSTWDTSVAFWNFAKAERDPKRVRIEINARQWAWDVRYAGPDGQFNTRDDIVTLNDMRVPVDAPVDIQLAATDVIHSLYLPHVRQKMDAVPGTVNRLWFQAKKTGRYEMACAQHCGMAHYKMAGVLTVLPQDEYAAWAERASANSALAYDEKDAEAHWGWPWLDSR